MFCPKCGYEYRPEITECSDCAVPLLDTMPASKPEFSIWDNDEVAIFASEDIALMTKAVEQLINAGISYRVQGPEWYKASRTGFIQADEDQAPRAGRIVVLRENAPAAIKAIKNFKSTKEE